MSLCIFVSGSATESVGDLAPDEESALIPLEAVTSEDNDSSEHKHLEEDQQMTNCRQDLKAVR